jgi:glycosyltransferase involved in cell wall biosynthesis
VSISQEVAVTVRNLYGHEIETPVIYNGIPTGKFSVCSNRKDEDDNIILLHVGRFSLQKNHKLLIEAFALAVKRMLKITSLVGGRWRIKVRY